MSSEFRTTLKVFIWKICKEKQYYWKKNLFYTLLPIVLLLVPLALLDKIDTGSDVQEKNQVFEPDTAKELLGVNLSNDVIYYTPNNNLAEQIMEKLRQKLKIKDEALKGFKNENQLQSIIKDENNQRFVIVNFQLDQNTTQLPKKIEYTIRVRHNGLKTNEIYLKSVEDSYSDPSYYAYASFPYRDSGFLSIKLALDIAITESLSIRQPDFDISLTKYPQPAGQQPRKVYFDTVSGSLAVMFVSLYIYLIILPSLEVKATGFLEHLKNATSHSYLNGAVIYVVNLVQIIIMLLACFVILSVYNVFGCMNIGYPLLFAIMFATAMMSFTFLMREIFNSVVCATICAPLYYLIPVIVFNYFSSPSIKFLELCFPVKVFLLGIELFQNYINTAHCFGLDDVMRKTHPTGPHSFFELCLGLLFSTFFYLVVAYGVASFFPGKYGTPLTFRDILDRFKSNNDPTQITPTESEEYPINIDGDNRKIEKIINGKPVVRIRNLCKTFKSLWGHKNEVVKDFSLDIYENQITALLGHNGAGKTTTMCMLTGMVSRTSGTVCVNGISNVHSYRTTIGFCPQHNIFIPYLTCKQHLLFFGQLRGLSTEKAQQQANQILEDINLVSKADVAAHTLSGGMQRRLTLANAVIGETKLLVLDEPSSGLDPESRRELWDVLLRLKKNHSILITTHYMEEADVLGDRIAIMENGELLAYGTSMYLKKAYGNGYTLKMLKADKNRFSVTKALDLIRKIIPDADVKDSVDVLCCVVLPYDQQDKYVSVLRALENMKEDLHIESISITNTTLEEVFLNSAANDKRVKLDTDETDSKNQLLHCGEPFAAENKPNVLQQLLAIQYKKLVYWRRNWSSLVGMFSILSFALFVIYFSGHGNQSEKAFETTKISMEKILNPQVMLAVKSANSSTMQQLISLFRNNVERDKAKFEVLYNVDMNAVLLEMAKNDKYRYNENMVAAFEVSVNEATKHISIEGFYTRNMLHSVSIAMNLATNVLTQFYSDANYTIDVINAPVSRTDTLSSKFLTIFLFANIMPFAFMLTLFMFIRLPFNEYWTKSKQIQNISHYVYWLGNYMADIILFAFLCGFVVLLSICLDKYDMFTLGEYGQLFPIFFVFGSVYMILIYVISQMFSTINGSITFLSYLQILTMFAALILAIPGVQEDYNVLITMFYLLPDFAFRQTLLAFADNKKFGGILTGKPVDYTKFFVAMLLSALILSSFLLLVCENLYTRDQFDNFFYRMKILMGNFCRKKKTKCQDEVDGIVGPRGDDEVDRERELVKKCKSKELTDKTYSVVASKLKKNFRELKAVRGIDFAVEKGECFGLLGMNGAGKTTTFNMMTLCETLSDGTIEVNDLCCTADKYEYKSQFGYCPQVDALNPLMTAYEILKYFAWIRGVPRHLLPNTVDYWLKRVDIDEFRDKQVQFYSGGTKRKLNTAVAMVGFPPLIFLDEPTTGVDPKSRRYVWNCVKEFQHQNKTIVLTSHSMDECETLCNRLAIMSKGSFTCIGGIQQLKNKYGKGFTLMLKLSQTQINQNNLMEYQAALNKLKYDIASKFKSNLKDEHGGLLYYFIHDEHIQWSSVFEKLLKLQEDHSTILDDFSINEIGLEEIFLQFRDAEQRREATTSRL